MLWQVRDIPISIQNVFYEYLKTVLARQPLVGVQSFLKLLGIFLEPLCHISIKIGVTSFMTRWPQYFGRLITVPCQLVSLASSCHSSSGNVFPHLGNMHAA